MLLTSNHGGGRSQVDVVGRALYQACRSSAPRARSIRDAIQGRARTQSTQQRNPTLPNREKAVTDQRDILLLASPAGSLSAPRSRADCRSDGGPYCTGVIAASPTTGREIRRRRRQNRRRRYRSMATFQHGQASTCFISVRQFSSAASASIVSDIITTPPNVVVGR